MKTKFQKVKIIYIILFVVLFLELIGALGAIFSSNPAIRDAGINNVFLIILTIVVMAVPWVIEVKYDVDIPDSLEMVMLVMVLIAVILGFLFGYYEYVIGFDKFTHTLSGIALSIIAYRTILYMSDSSKIPLKLGSGFIAIFTYMFSLTLLVFWEFYEFSVDTIGYNLNKGTFRNMQKYQWENTSTIFPQDYGLFDTMIDLIVGSIGATIVAVIAYFILEHRRKNKPV